MNLTWAFSAILASTSLAAADPDPRQLHEAAVAASEKLTAISYKAVVEATGGMAAGMPAVKGAVIIAKGGSSVEELPARFSIDAEVRDEAPAPHHIVIGFDGKTITLLDHTAHQFQTEDLAANPMAMMSIDDPSLNLLVLNFLDKRAWGEPDEIASFKLAGRAEVGGVPCDVVVVEHKLGPDQPPADPARPADPTAPPTTFSIHEYLGVDDHLLRKLEMPIPDMNGPGTPGTPSSALVVTLTEVSAQPTIDNAAFTPAVPEGYTKHETQESAEGPSVSLNVGDHAPDWTLKDPDGKEHKLADYKDQVVIMDFWATWCPPCRESMPGVQKLHEQFKDRGVNVLGVNVAERADPVAFMKSKGYTYGLLVEGDKVAEAYGVSMIPQFFVIGGDGTILHHSAGGEEGQMAEVIEQYLKDHGK